MDKNTVIGLVLIAGLLIAYSLFTRPSREEQAEMQRIRDSIEQAQQQTLLEEQQQAQEPQAEAPSAQAAEPEPPSAEVETVPDPESYADLYGSFAEGATGTRKFITLENEKVRLVVSTLGGRPYSVELKEHQTHDGQPLVLFDGDSTVFGLTFFAQNRSINTDELFFIPDTESGSLDATADSVVLSLRLPAGEERYLEYVYTMRPDDYMVDFDMRFVNLHEVISMQNDYVDLNWDVFVPQLEMGRVNEMNATTIFYKHFQDEVDKLRMRSKKEFLEADIPTRLRWVAYKGHFFSSVLIADDHFANAYVRSNRLEENPRYLNTFESEIGIPYNLTPTYEQSMRFYFGPNHYNTLKNYGLELQRLLALGGFFSQAINRYAIIPVFNFLDNFIESYGLIILLLTILIKLVLFPLTWRSYVSMAKMRLLKPEIDAINEKIPKEKAMERQQATMALYKKAGVSPLGGCLPMILQMPILIAMFRFFPASIELRQEKFLWAHDLSTYDSILDLPFNIPMYGDHVSLFTLLMTASTILTMRISNQASASQSQMPGMKGMMYIMPIMFMFILNNFSAALTYYYFLANVITFGQNQLVKLYIDEDAMRQKMKSNQKKPAKKKQSGFQKRLEDMARQRGYQPPKKR